MIMFTNSSSLQFWIQKYFSLWSEDIGKWFLGFSTSNRNFQEKATISLEIESLVLICLVMKQVNVMKKMCRNIEETFQTVLKYIFIVLSLLFSYRNINYINVGLIKISIVPFINFKICSSNYGTCWKNTHIT